ncbi:MAG TPA: 2-succinyl-5-enolpyruvyl-6-hydroxy-3-cyclohexene-1-carboxylic-acid synthase [Solirubrobacteraceae bacterium]|jgi:2-succinyl-5-enolpyruvyl-6-hydroxy-3-cyclohexene-1-carboxylate synthase|nr:2-succinyl-5-enolpyruvyl-6-hydroxy-3-cyclohexene-1-carboxylic-acid synthase [Solirubrobacteraceae bacterium]
MSSAADTHLLLRAFVDELVRCGLRDACTSPGSRCAPLVLSLAGEPRLRCHSHIDERCGGFFALGLAKASGLPVALACTSGTAAAELLPAAIEAHEAGVPLLILTADRPSELRENGAGQAIDQIKLFGGAAKWFFEVDAPGAGEEGLRWMRTLACRAYWRSLEGRPGVVHLNFPLREPLMGDGRALPPDETGRPDGAPYVRRPVAHLHAPGAMAELSALAAGATRGVLVAGRHERPTALGRAAAELCEAAGWPLLADPLSGARRGEAAVAHYDALLRDPAFAARARPDLVIRVGALPVSKPLRQWLAGLGDVPQAILDPEGDWQDPASVLAGSLALEPARALRRLTEELAGGEGSGRDSDLPPPASTLVPAPPTGPLALADPDWLSGWRSADERAAEALLGVLAGGEHNGEEDGLSEPALAAELGVLLPAEATLFVASSMPVRDIESFWPVRPDPPRVLCNRGANGIDGTVSSAFGAAADGGGPVVLLIGDVALAHDLGGLIAARRLSLDLTIVLLDNGGGGIFDFLPIAAAPPELYTQHIATPTSLDFSLAARLYGLEHELVGDIQAFRAALERALAEPPRRSGIIEVRTDRAKNVALHRRAWEAVAGALDGAA